MLDELLQAEIDEILEKAAFTIDQRKIFDLLHDGELNDKGIIERLSMERHKYYKIKKQVMNKIIKIIEKS